MLVVNTNSFDVFMAQAKVSNNVRVEDMHFEGQEIHWPADGLLVFKNCTGKIDGLYMNGGRVLIIDCRLSFGDVSADDIEFNNSIFNINSSHLTGTGATHGLLVRKESFLRGCHGGKSWYYDAESGLLTFGRSRGPLESWVVASLLTDYHTAMTLDHVIKLCYMEKVA